MMVEPMLYVEMPGHVSGYMKELNLLKILSVLVGLRMLLSTYGFDRLPFILLKKILLPPSADAVAGPPRLLWPLGLGDAEDLGPMPAGGTWMSFLLGLTSWLGLCDGDDVSLYE